MANEQNKDFNAMLRNNKDMPKMQIINDEKVLKNMAASDVLCPAYLTTTK